MTQTRDESQWWRLAFALSLTVACFAFRAYAARLDRFVSGIRPYFTFDSQFWGEVSMAVGSLALAYAVGTFLIDDILAQRAKQRWSAYEAAVTGTIKARLFLAAAALAQPLTTHEAYGVSKGSLLLEAFSQPPAELAARIRSWLPDVRATGMAKITDADTDHLALNRLHDVATSLALDLVLIDQPFLVLGSGGDPQRAQLASIANIKRGIFIVAGLADAKRSQETSPDRVIESVVDVVSAIATHLEQL